MNKKTQGADLILRLYELRREETMRQARSWFVDSFNPQKTEDIFNILTDGNSAAYRMVVSYWDMAAAFVNYGAIDEQMFNDINTEHIVIYAKLQPFLAELGSIPGMLPYFYLKNLEPLVLRIPDAKDRIKLVRQYIKNR